MADKRLLAEVMASKSPVNPMHSSSAGRSIDLPDPIQAPFIPKIGPNDPCLKQAIVFFPNLFNAIESPIEVSVLPSPDLVGVIAVTNMTLALGSSSDL